MRLRKPNFSEARGLKNVFSEMEAIAADLSNYDSKDEQKRGRDIEAALEYVKKALMLATGSEE